MVRRSSNGDKSDKSKGVNDNQAVKTENTEESGLFLEVKMVVIRL